MKFQFLMENKTEREGCTAEHGLSIYIEAQGKKLVFDAGASSLFTRNAEHLNVDLSRADALIISHGHYDHTGGVPEFCRINSKAPVYIHKEAFYESYGMKDERIKDKNSGIRWSREEKAAIEPRMVLTEGPLWIHENIVISGTVPEIPGYGSAETFCRRTSHGDFVPDPMDHEQILAIREPEGLYVFSGCSHRGVVPAVRYARSLFDGAPVAVLVAGMHLYSAQKELRQKVIRQLLEENVERIIPVHCTGIHAICDLKEVMGEKCIVATTGSSYGY